nr:hypothetical protein [Eikenella corrodens]
MSSGIYLRVQYSGLNLNQDKAASRRQYTRYGKASQRCTGLNLIHYTCAEDRWKYQIAAIPLLQSRQAPIGKQCFSGSLNTLKGYLKKPPR